MKQQTPVIIKSEEKACRFISMHFIFHAYPVVYRLKSQPTRHFAQTLPSLLKLTPIFSKAYIPIYAGCTYSSFNNIHYVIHNC